MAAAHDDDVVVQGGVVVHVHGVDGVVFEEPARTR